MPKPVKKNDVGKVGDLDGASVIRSAVAEAAGNTHSMRTRGKISSLGKDFRDRSMVSVGVEMIGGDSEFPDTEHFSVPPDAAKGLEIGDEVTIEITLTKKA